MRRRGSTSGNGSRACGSWVALIALAAALAVPTAAGAAPLYDAWPPDTTITTGADAGSTTTPENVVFTFAASEPATFACKLDTAAWAACTSPRPNSHLAPGPHTFAVRAIDLAGNVDPTPATRSWTRQPYISTTSYAAGSLAGRAQADPFGDFRVIIQVPKRSLLAQLGAQADEFGQLKHTFSSIAGVNARLPGWAVLYLIERGKAKYDGRVVVTEDTRLRATSLENGPRWQASAGVDLLWKASKSGSTPAIAIVDSGIDATHVADFGSRIVASHNFSSLSPEGSTGDGEGHGTMVAGIAAGASATTQGVAQSAPIVDLRTSDASGKSLTSDVIQAIDWILTNKATYDIRVANFSMAGLRDASFMADPLDRAVEQLWLSGVVVVAAAGNNGNPDGPAQIGAPGNDPFVITVGALDQSGTEDPADDFRAPWSAYGYTGDGFAKPDLAAPGRQLVMPVPLASTIAGLFPDRIVAPGYVWMSGTSFSAPIVAGIAAQLLAVHPRWTPDQVKGALMLSARPTAAGGLTAGVGEVDGAGAAEVVGPPNPNLHLYDFVTTDATTGERSFDGPGWRDVVSATAEWNQAEWNAAEWNAAEWNMAEWNMAEWNMAEWNMAEWNMAEWNMAEWNMAAFPR